MIKLNIENTYKMMMELNSENRSQRLVAHRRVVSQRHNRRCSFCRQPGHYITRCNSERLIEFEVICADVVRNITVPDDFKNWLFQNYVNDQLLLKTFVISKFGYTSRININRCIDIISDYIFRTYRNNEHNTNTNNTSNDTADNFENDLIYFLGQLRNNVLREEPEIQDVPNIERIVLREMFLSFLYNLNMNQRMSPDILQGSSKFNINLIIDISDDVVNENNTTLCNICWDDKENNTFVKFGCKHEFCKECVITSFRGEQQQRRHPCCALCRSEVKTITTKCSEIHSELSEFTRI
jgi:hypothetical protein